jgi:hypothetical protein
MRKIEVRAALGQRRAAEAGRYKVNGSGSECCAAARSVRERTEFVTRVIGVKNFWFFADFSCIEGEYPYSA